MPGPSLTRGQQTFASTLSRETGLNPRVVGAWALAEQSGGAAQGYEQRGYHNWLNIANTDSGPAHGSASAVWRNPVTAARATSEWLRGAGPIAREYGKPAPGIMQILRAGADPMAQIQAIARSGWASNGYEGGSSLRQLYGELAGLKLPTGTPGAGAPGAQFNPGSPLTVQSPSTPTGDPQALSELVDAIKSMSGPAIAAAGAHAELPAYARKGAGSWMPALGITQPQAQASQQKQLLALAERALGGGNEVNAQVTQARPPSVTGGEGYAPAGSHGGALAGLLPAHAMLKLGRIDEGQDGQTTPGGPIIANGNGYVKEVKSDPAGFGPSYPVVVFTSGPLSGPKYAGGVYLGHTLAALKPGQRFGTGQVLSRTGTSGVGNATVPGWFEIGLARTLGEGDRGQGALIAPGLR